MAGARAVTRRRWIRFELDDGWFEYPLAR